MDFLVDKFTAPGTNPVRPTNEQISVTGAQVGPTAVGQKVIRTNSLAESTFTIEIQQTSTSSITDGTRNGVAHFDSESFATDYAGYVTLLPKKFDTDSGRATTLDGVLKVLGASGASGNSPIFTNASGNTVTMGAQRSQALAAADTTKVGLANFDSAYFSVVDGFVSSSKAGFGETLTGTTGGAINPTAGNWNILGATAVAGTAPVVVTGSGSTETVKVQTSQAIASADVAKIGLSNFDSADFHVDSGGFVTLSGGGHSFVSLIPSSGTSPVVADAQGEITINGTGSIATVGTLNTLTSELIGLTSHSVLVGSGSSTITKVAPGAAGIPLVSKGAAADPAFGVVSVAGGGTGVGSLTEGGILLGSGEANVTVTNQPTDGQFLIGKTGVDPVLSTLTAGNGIEVTNGTGTITLDAAATVALSFVSDSGTSIPAANVLKVLGGTGLNTVGTTDTLTLNLDAPVTVQNGGTGAGSFTDGGVLLGAGSAKVTATTRPTDGQVLLGATSADPVFKSLTSSDGSIVFSAGANTLDLVVDGGVGAETITGDSGGALSPIAGNWNILGGVGVDTSGSGSTLTINSAGAGLAWTVIAVNQTAAVNSGYVCNKSSALELLLPTTAMVGDIIRVTNLNTALGIKITQNNSQQIHMGNVATTAGAAGNIQSSAIRDSLELVAVVSGSSTIWNVLSSQGIWTLT